MNRFVNRATLQNRGIFRRAVLSLSLLLIALRWISQSAVGEPPAPVPPPSPTAPSIEPRNDLPGLKNVGKVSDALWRGAQPTKEGFQTLKSRGIKTIVDLRSEHSDRALLAGTGLQYVEIPCDPLRIKDAEVVEFLKVVGDPKNQPVFVHCACGCDRTGMMVGAYELLDLNRSTGAALKDLHKFGYHPLFREIQSHLKDFDRAAVRRKVDAAAAPKVELIK